MVLKQPILLEIARVLTFVHFWYSKSPREHDVLKTESVSILW